MLWLTLGISLLLSAGVVCLSLACFHYCVLAPRWRRSTQALERTKNEWHAYDDVVPRLEEAKRSARRDRGRADRRKSFA